MALGAAAAAARAHTRAPGGGAVAVRGGATTALHRIAAPPAPLRMRAVSLRRQRCEAGHRRSVRVVAALSDECDANATSATPLAPLQPTSSAGSRLQWSLAHHTRRGEFGTLLSAHIEVLVADAEAELLRQSRSLPPMAPADNALRRRLMQLRREQRAATSQDIIYAIALSRIIDVRASLTPPLAGVTTSLCRLEHGGALLSVHSAEAAQVVRAHVRATIDGGGAGMPGGQVVRCATAQLAQVYYSTLLLGYFVRAVDYRFRLDRQLGTLPTAGLKTEPTAAERWPFAAVIRKLAARDAVHAGDAQAFDAYITSFHEKQLLSPLLDGITPECKLLMLRHTTALFGDVAQLQLDFAAAHGELFLAVQNAQQGADTDEARRELASRVRDDVLNQRLANYRMRVDDMRHMVIEAAAVGALLRDAEAFVQSQGMLLGGKP